MTRALFPDLVVNGEHVPQAAIAAEAQHHDAPKGKPGIAWRKAANAVAMRTLLLQEARRRGVDPQPQQVGQGRMETDEEALVRGLLDQAVEVETPSKAEIRAIYERDPSRFRAPPLWEVSHILCAGEGAEERARALASEVIANPKSFARVARRDSACGSAGNGGALGQLGPGDTLPEFEAALRGLSEGDITEQPILSRHGWHIIRLDAVAEGRVLPFEAVAPRLSEAIEKCNWARAARAFAEGLMAEADIAGADFTVI